MGAYASLLKGLNPEQVKTANFLNIANKASSSFTGLTNAVRHAPYIISLLTTVVYSLLIFITFAMPYIILGFVIYVLYCICSGKSIWPKSSNSSKSSSSSSWFDPKYFLSHETKMFINSYNPGGKTPKTTPRPLMKSGRCDNISFVEDSQEGTYGNCESTKIPDDIIFDIDQSQIPEYISLPKNLKKTLEPGLHIRIPYSKTPEETFYVPQCDKATYSDGSPVDLYDEAGMSCKLSSFSIINTKLEKQDKLKGYYLDKDYIKIEE